LKEARLSEYIPLKLRQRVPDYELDTYEPAKRDFSTFSLASQIEKKRWTILFFYPADFTFV
jgi:peroxiredoxin (alkyl hydroperoxide reductase subunit C)